jgi:hypothetical protein
VLDVVGEEHRGHAAVSQLVHDPVAVGQRRLKTIQYFGQVGFGGGYRPTLRSGRVGGQWTRATASHARRSGPAPDAPRDSVAPHRSAGPPSVFRQHAGGIAFWKMEKWLTAQLSAICYQRS